jgi:glycosyltransferase involved in cell wall biosynthesis
MSAPEQPTLLVISQVYPPDPTSVGQHMHDVAREMARRGWRVIVYCADRGYNDPAQRFPARELMEGVEVRRLPLSSFGKRSILIRLLGGLSLLWQATLRGLFVPSLDCILVSTSPPMCSAAAWVISLVRRRVKITYWVMDLNPDQLIEMGLVKPASPLVKIFDWFNRRVLARATNVVALDRFMAQRILRKRDVRDKLTIMPPWPHEDHLEMIPPADNPFRHKHQLDDKFVVLYSGNHSVFTPLRTILDAMIRLRDHDKLRFLFIGGGTGKPEVDETIAEHNLTNALSLPYQPIDQIKYSLSAGDLHLVVIGNEEVGVRHPCKIYGAMALARPVLLLGPDPCHVSDLMQELQLGWHIQHGQVDQAVAVLQEIAAKEPSELAAMGQRGRRKVEHELNMTKLLGRMCDLIERSRTHPTR